MANVDVLPQQQNEVSYNPSDPHRQAVAEY